MLVRAPEIAPLNVVRASVSPTATTTLMSAYSTNVCPSSRLRCLHRRNDDAVDRIDDHVYPPRPYIAERLETLRPPAYPEWNAGDQRALCSWADAHRSE